MRMTPRRVLFIAIGLGIATVATLVILYREPLKEVLKPVAEYIRKSPYGYIFIATGIFITSFPPLVGYTSIVAFSGFLYGFPLGFLPVAVGSWLGAVTSFLIIRHFKLRRLVERFTKSDSRYTALEEAVEEGGFGILLMIRLCPFPQPAVNGFFAIVPKIEFTSFAAASFISMFKLLIDIWVGSRLGEVADPTDPDPHTHFISYITLAVGIAILVLTMWWIYRTTMRRVEVLAKRHEQRINSESEPLLHDASQSVGSNGDLRERWRPASGGLEEV